MSNKATYSALQKRQVSISAYSVATLDYIDSQPNYFRIQNSGDSTLYCATAHIPTTENYDFMVSGGGMRMFAEPFERSKLYIFNPSGSSVNVTVLSFKAEFDPLTLAMSDVSIDLNGASLEANNVIKSFETSLPSGSNNIGKVTLADLATLTAKLDELKNRALLVQYGGASVNIGDVLSALETVLSSVNSSVGKVETAVKNIDISGGGGGANRFAPDNKIVIKSRSASTASETFTLPEDCRAITKINFIANDSDEGEMTVTLSSGEAVTIKAGEVLNDLDLYEDNSIGFSHAGAAPAFRFVVTCYK